MPNVGGKKFPYTPAGKRAAGSYARATGQPMGNAGGYGGGNPGRGGYGGENGGEKTGSTSGYDQERKISFQEDNGSEGVKTEGA